MNPEQIKIIREKIQALRARKEQINGEINMYQEDANILRTERDEINASIALLIEGIE